jgi:uncharacterized protein
MAFMDKKQYIHRELTEQITKRLFKGKVIILYGPRQVGKTTLLEHILSEYADKKVLRVYGDDVDARMALEDASIAKLQAFVAGFDIVYIDEAQYVTNIGVALKLLHDHCPDVQVLATGSSSFELANKIIEPLTGRHYSFYLFPLSLTELMHAHDRYYVEARIDERLIYGSYPAVVLGTGDAKEVLTRIADDYSSKDVLRFEKVRNAQVLVKLLRALALQIGNEVSYNEIAGTLGIDKETITRYVSILEQSFIIFTLEPYADNARRALKRKRKIYFWDVGLRNALIANLNSLDLRTDSGHIFENFVIAEFLKKDRETLLHHNYFFYRAYDGEEIDLLVERNGVLEGYECKVTSDKPYITKSADAPVQKVTVITKRSAPLFFEELVK